MNKSKLLYYWQPACKGVMMASGVGRLCNLQRYEHSISTINDCFAYKCALYADIRISSVEFHT